MSTPATPATPSTTEQHSIGGPTWWGPQLAWGILAAIAWAIVLVVIAYSAPTFALHLSRCAPMSSETASLLITCICLTVVAASVSALTSRRLAAHTSSGATAPILLGIFFGVVAVAMFYLIGFGQSLGDMQGVSMGSLNWLPFATPLIGVVSILQLIVPRVIPARWSDRWVFAISMVFGVVAWLALSLAIVLPPSISCS